MTRKELKKRGFAFRTFKKDPRQFGIYLTKEGRKLYRNEVEAMMAIRIAYTEVPRKEKGGGNAES